MSDIIERIRAGECWCEEAADELERLRNDLAWIAATIDLALSTEPEEMDYRRLLNNLRKRAIAKAEGGK
jgi:hypothetical protein